MSSTAVEQDTRPVASQRTPQDLYRLLILRNGGSELLVASERPPFTLPCVEIPNRTLVRPMRPVAERVAGFMGMKRKHVPEKHRGGKTSTVFLGPHLILTFFR
jgi:hypothetical protein